MLNLIEDFLSAEAAAWNVKISWEVWKLMLYLQIAVTVWQISWKVWICFYIAHSCYSLRCKYLLQPGNISWNIFFLTLLLQSEIFHLTLLFQSEIFHLLQSGKWDKNQFEVCRWTLLTPLCKFKSKMFPLKLIVLLFDKTYIFWAQKMLKQGWLHWHLVHYFI